jgi:deazaflavin-dependent oxidoreductase (nitroreductase family)
MMNALLGLSVVAYRLLGDRMRVQGRPLLLLHTTGAKSGQPRKTLVGWFPDGDDAWLVVASAAGSARHPAWYVNMVRNPDKVWIEIGKRKLKVEPESLKGDERAEAWHRIVSLAPGYAAYQEKTDRELPVVRLKPMR